MWDILFNFISNQTKNCSNNCQIILWGHSLASWLPIKLHIFVFTNGGEANSPWWVILIAAAPVPLHSSLLCFPQAKASECIWFACLRGRVWVGDAPEGLWLCPGSADQERCHLRSLCVSSLLLLEDRARSWFSARGRSGCGKFTPSACDSPYRRYLGKGEGLRSGLHPDASDSQPLSGERRCLINLPVVISK